MENEPLVSVIIPCYNVSAYVEEAIRSILHQTYTNLEIFIIDDASSDDTLQKIQSFKDKRIIVKQYKSNTQKIGAVNDVLKEVKGDFIAFQDADDWSEPDKIKIQLQQFLSQPDLGICFTKYKRLNDNFIPANIALTNEELGNEFFNFFKRKDTRIQPTLCATMMISRSVLEVTKGYHPYFIGKPGEDSHWVYRILKNFKGIGINKVLYNYQFRQDSFTQIQLNGNNAKYAYSWQLLSLILEKDYYEKIDVLEKENIALLKEVELKACENALVSKIKELNETKKSYENSYSYRVGKLLIKPIQFLKKYY